MNHTLTLTRKSLHTVCFECDLDISGYVIANLPVADWKEMGCPKEIVLTLTPVIALEQMEAMIA